MLSRSTLVWVATAVVAATAAFVGAKAFTIYQAPRMVMSTIEDTIAQRAGGWNACWHNRQFGPVPGGAKRANPDSVVTLMAYDLFNGPVRVSGETWPDYWSMSLYQQNSDNYFVTNDRDIERGKFDFIIALPGHKLPDHKFSAANTRRINSPTNKGIMLIRRFVKEEADMPALLENQDLMRCNPLALHDPVG
ncbi:hypothetical protein GCM10023115_17890 [Pontixanthobacter gangjinensis]|uniref:DUF1254 domain-containing protein n=1 Tax=Pontixanthobacter gangjinensis TaxID=1028742 RepID=A0A6I4SMW5_9SPHN|nr:DUF1254 domain-containing protein [Pontixanthobacter gangjinensis]MXO57034.1 DUF1254 domain-containing protein [Pontixanthobacter gangjinensis]